MVRKLSIIRRVPWLPMSWHAIPPPLNHNLPVLLHGFLAGLSSFFCNTKLTGLCLLTLHFPATSPSALCCFTDHCHFDVRLHSFRKKSLSFMFDKRVMPVEWMDLSFFQKDFYAWTFRHSEMMIFNLRWCYNKRPTDASLPAVLSTLRSTPHASLCVELPFACDILEFSLGF